VTKKCDECGAELSGHYGSCSKLSPTLLAIFQDLERKQSPAAHGMIPSRRQGKTAQIQRTLAGAKERVRRVAGGATINGIYKAVSETSLEAFRADLVLILSHLP
jgi:hypothetical protein